MEVIKAPAFVLKSKKIVTFATCFVLVLWDQRSISKLLILLAQVSGVLEEIKIIILHSNLVVSFVLLSLEYVNSGTKSLNLLWP